MTNSQTLVLATCIGVVAFITLLQNPLLGSAHWLPLLGLGWVGACGFTLAMQSALPMPQTEQ